MEKTKISKVGTVKLVSLHQHKPKIINYEKTLTFCDGLHGWNRSDGAVEAS